jgi:hypothetical protein
MRLRWLLASFLLLAGGVAAVRYDMTKEELLKELGKPTSVMARPGSGREVLIYPNGVRIEIEKDRVVSVKGLALEPSDGTPVAQPAEAAEAVPEAGEPRPAPEPQPARVEGGDKAEQETAAADARARAEMEKAIAGMENLGDRQQEPARPAFTFTSFLFELFIKWLLMLAALKLTCKYWNADVDWSGLMLAAAADTGVQAVVGIIGKVVLQMFTVFYADEAVGAAVLVLVLRKVSTNQSLQQAVTITMTSKVFSIVVGSFLVTVLLRALH